MTGFLLRRESDINLDVSIIVVTIIVVILFTRPKYINNKWILSQKNHVCLFFLTSFEWNDLTQVHNRVEHKIVFFKWQILAMLQRWWQIKIKSGRFTGERARITDLTRMKFHDSREATVFSATLCKFKEPSTIFKSDILSNFYDLYS